MTKLRLDRLTIRSFGSDCPPLPDSVYIPDWSKKK